MLNTKCGDACVICRLYLVGHSMAADGYAFEEFEAGKKPPSGWDVADAVRDGWGKREIDAYMRATVMPLDEWREWAREEWGVGVAGEPAQSPQSAPPRSAGPTPAQPSQRPAPEPATQQPVAQAKPTRQDVPQQDNVVHLATRKPVPADDNWQFELVCNAEGKTKPGVTRNWSLFLQHDSEMRGVLAFDLFAGRTMLVERPPWALTDKSWKPRVITDVEIQLIVEWLEVRHLTPKHSNVMPAIERVAKTNAYHPVRDYLAGLPEWDGVSRLDGWLSTFAGVTETALTRAFSRKTLCAAVRRVRQPGCKFDHVLVLAGPEGIGKSRLISALCPDQRWFGDQLRIGSDAKTVIEQSSGKWIIEMAELIGAGRREVEAVKHFVTTQTDRARKAYARVETEAPRQFVLFGTSNEGEFLTSLTGNRRFWVVDAGRADVDGLIQVRDQLWAEAVAAEPDEALHLEGDLYAANDAANVDKTDYGPWYDALATAIPDGDVKLPVRHAWLLVGIKQDEVHRISDQHRRSLQKALAGLGFDTKAVNLKRRGGQVKAFVRGDRRRAAWWPREPGDDQPELSEGDDW